MRALVFIAGLLIVLAIVGLTTRQQLHTAAPAAERADTVPASTPDAPTDTPQQRVQQVQQEVQRALEQGAARASEADR